MGSPSNWRMALEFQVFYFFKGILLKSVLRILIGGWNKFWGCFFSACFYGGGCFNTVVMLENTYTVLQDIEIYIDDSMAALLLCDCGGKCVDA